jgi:hypothetical protein
MNICTDIDTIIEPCANYLKAVNGQGFCKRNDRWRCVEWVVRHNPILSASSVSMFNQCLRKYYHTNIQGYQLIEQDKMKALCSVIFHAFVAGLHTGDKKYTEKGLKLYDRLYEQYKDDNYQKQQLLKIKPSINAYHYHGFHKSGGRAEVKKFIDHGKYQLKTIVDLIKDNKMADWKYTANPDYYTMFTTEHQAGLYLMSYPKVESITYFLIRVPDAKLAGNESESDFQDRIERDMCNRKDHYFIQKTFHRAEYDFDQIMQELTYTANEIVNNLEKPLYYWRQNRSGCWQFGKWCDFYTCCESRVMPQDLPHLYKQYDVEDLMLQGK